MSTNSSLDPQQATALFDQVIKDLQQALTKLGPEHLDALLSLSEDILAAWRTGGQFLICGNGGSAADSQHIAAELVGRFMADRPGYRAEALTVNTSTLTAVGNDYGFDHIFSRQVQAKGRPGDVLLVISTSGNSANCVLAVEEARRQGMKVHGFLGGDGGALKSILDGAMIAPSPSSPKIQEIHITMGHLLCMFLEKGVEKDNG